MERRPQRRRNEREEVKEMIQRVLMDPILWERNPMAIRPMAADPLMLPGKITAVAVFAPCCTAYASKKEKKTRKCRLEITCKIRVRETINGQH